MRKQDYYEPSIGRESEPRRRPKKKKKRANRGERAVVQVDDVKLLVHVHLREHAEQAEACIIYHNLEIVAAHRTVQQAAFLLIAHIRRNHMAHGRQLGRKLAQTLLAPCAQHQLAAALSECERHFAPQSRGSAGNQRLHITPSISRCFGIIYQCSTARPARQTENGDRSLQTGLRFVYICCNLTS